MPNQEIGNDKVGHFLHAKLDFKEESRYLASQLGWPIAISVYQANVWIREFVKSHGFMNNAIIALPDCTLSQLLGAQVLHCTEIKSRILPHLSPPVDLALSQVYHVLLRAYTRFSWHHTLTFGLLVDQNTYEWNPQFCALLGVGQLATIRRVSAALRRYVTSTSRNCVLIQNNSIVDLSNNPLGSFLGRKYLSTRDVYTALSCVRQCKYNVEKDSETRFV